MGINPTNTAHNSLNRPSGRNATTEPPNKRQKLGSSPAGNFRFATSPPSSNKRRLVESNRTANDLFEHDSNTTDAGNGRTTAQARQSQYRDTQSKGDPGKKRIRKSRQRQGTAVSSRGSPSSDPEQRPTSPDPLGQDPPPANVSSDVAASRGAAKRERRPSLSEPHVKRPKAASTRRESIDNLADELSWDSNSKPSSRQTGLQPMTSGGERHRALRGDIVPTTFSSSKTKTQASSRKLEKPFAVKRAVSGSLLLQSTSEERYSLIPTCKNDGKVEELHLLLEKVDVEGNVLDKLGVDESLASCMTIDFEKLSKVQHDMTRSEFAIISRRVSPGQPPKLTIEFSSVAECSRLVGMFPTGLCQQDSR